MWEQTEKSIGIRLVRNYFWLRTVVSWVIISQDMTVNHVSTNLYCFVFVCWHCVDIQSINHVPRHCTPDASRCVGVTNHVITIFQAMSLNTYNRKNAASRLAQIGLVELTIVRQRPFLFACFCHVKDAQRLVLHLYFVWRIVQRLYMKTTKQKQCG